MSVWKDMGVRGEAEKTSRRKLVMAGLWTDFCVALSAIQAIKLGYEVYVLKGACGDLNTRAQDTAIQRMIQAGARPMECKQVLAELQQHGAYLMPGVQISLHQQTS